MPRWCRPAAVAVLALVVCVTLAPALTTAAGSALRVSAGAAAPSGAPTPGPCSSGAPQCHPAAPLSPTGPLFGALWLAVGAAALVVGTEGRSLRRRRAAHARIPTGVSAPVLRPPR